MKDASVPKISIIIPMFNCERYIKECLESLDKQTFKDFEILLIDDGSTDSTQEVISDYAEESTLNIKMIEQENGGAARARNHGLDHATGEFVAFIDADDTVSPDYFETLLSHFDNSVDIVSCGYRKYDTATGRTAYVRSATGWELDFGNGVSHLLHYSPCAKLIRSDLIREYGLRFKEGEILEDGPFGIMTNSLARKNVAIPYIGYQYRIHEGSVQDAVRKEGMSEQSSKMNPPFGGLRIAIETVQANKDSAYNQALEYVIVKALAGYVFSFSKSDSSESIDYICEESASILDEYFPNVSQNEFIKVNRFTNLPLTHRLATVILLKSYEHGRLIPTAKFLHTILKHGKHI